MLVILLLFIHFTRDQICFEHLVESRHLVMYSEFFIVPCVKVRFKGYVLHSSKLNNKMKHKISDHFQHFFGLDPNLGGFFKGWF